VAQIQSLTRPKVDNRLISSSLSKLTTVDNISLSWLQSPGLVLWIQEASAVLEATARHAIYGVQWRRLDRKALGLFKDRFRV